MQSGPSKIIKTAIQENTSNSQIPTNQHGFHRDDSTDTASYGDSKERREGDDGEDGERTRGDTDAGEENGGDADALKTEDGDADANDDANTLKYDDSDEDHSSGEQIRKKPIGPSPISKLPNGTW